jgi:chloride channel 2
MKAMLSGVYIHEFLSIKAAIGKWIGLVFAMVGGLSMAIMGAYIHIACVIVNQLTKLKAFKDIANNKQLKLQMYSCAICAACCTNFGAPIGAVLFSLELTATFFLVGGLWKMLFCSTVVVIFS